MEDNLLRIKAIMQHYNYSQTDLGRRTGIPQTNISEMLRGVRSCGDKIITRLRKSFPEINPLWFIDINAPMFTNQHRPITQNNINGDNNFNTAGIMPVRCTEYGADVEVIEAEEVRRPIIPTEWTYQPNVDLYEKVYADISKVSRSRFIALDVPIDMWHIVRDDSLLPDCKRGDLIGLNAYPLGHEAPIPGKLHAVDTNSNGIIIRKLFFSTEGYRGVAPNTEYPDLEIKQDDIIRIYRIVCLARIAL